MVEIKVGLECHCYLNMDGRAKLFCDDAIESNATPNTNICPICTAMPGCKPMPANEDALKKIIAVALMLNCKINKRLLFQRKHYSWPDLPSGYQRTMSGSFSTPVGENGEFLGIGIADVHLEEDPARWDPETGTVDFNRSGFPLVEIVTKPDFRSAEQAREWLNKLVTTLGYIDAIDSDAGVKSDVNVSIEPKFNRVEIKNVNSFKSIMRAIIFEISRQERETKQGKKIDQETRAWNDTKGLTVFMRSKEQALDYMFIPDPDLPVINITDKYIKDIEKLLPEKPHEKIARYIKEFKIDKTDAEVICSELILAQLFEEVSREVSPVLAARWLRRELKRVANFNKKEISDLEIDARHLIKLLKLIETEQITPATARKILEKLIHEPFDVEEYVRKNELLAVSDKKHLEELCVEAVAENKQAVDDYRSGNEKALFFLTGVVMKKSRGKATPNEVNEILKKILQ